MKIVGMLTIVGILGWFGADVAADNAVKEIAIINEEGFADFDIPLMSAAQVDDGGWIIRASGSLGESRIGFDVRLGGEWKPQEMDDGAFTVFWGTGAIIRSGTESDGFCGLLQDAYELAGSSREMPELIETTVVSLGTDPKRIAQEPLKMKMFVAPDSDESEYAEFFLNIDLSSQIVEFHEKDNEYRKNLIKAFCR